MKNIKYLFLIVAGAFASCTLEYDRIFDKSAAERMAATLEEYQKVLVSAPNGWTMDYYSQYPESRTGGYVFIVSFDANGTAKIACQTDIVGDVTTATKVESSYELIADQGPVLTFNTYNRLLHQFSGPKGPGDIDGDAGDYEFVFMEVSADKIVMKGKKNDNTITLKALPAGTDWDEYIVSSVVMDRVNYYPFLQVSKNGTVVGDLVMTAYRVLQYRDEDGNVGEWMNTITTPQGFHLYEPTTFLDIVFDEFIWDEAEKVYRSPDGSVVLTGSYPEEYVFFDSYSGTYTMTYSNYNNVQRSRTVSIQEAPSGLPNVVINNFAPASSIYALYDRMYGKFYTGCQTLGSHPSGGNLEVRYWNGGSSVPFNSTLAEGVIGEAGGKKVITFKFPTSHIGFAIIRATIAGLYLVSADDMFSNIVLTEQ